MTWYTVVPGELCGSMIYVLGGATDPACVSYDPAMAGQSLPHDPSELNRE